MDGETYHGGVLRETEEKYQEEVFRALDRDNENKKRIGQVWKLSKEGMDAGEIADELDVSTEGFVHNYRRYIGAIIEGTLPTSPTLARQCRSALRGFLKRHPNFTSNTRERIENLIEACDDILSDLEKQRAEDQDLERKTSEGEKEEVAGIYVYTLPHYLRYPVEIYDNDETDNRTYLKIGMSKNDVIKRFRQQQTSTVLPEPPVLLRVYKALDGTDVSEEELERKIHQHLVAADHVRNSESGAGKEWFLTHLKLLDSTADLLNLETHFSIDDTFEGIDLSETWNWTSEPETSGED